MIKNISTNVTSKILDSLPIEGDEIVFDQHTRGQHESVWSDLQPGAYGYSNTPVMGFGNSWHETKENYDGWMAQCFDLYTEKAMTGDVDITDTCLFWRPLPGGRWLLVEIGNITD